MSSAWGGKGRGRGRPPSAPPPAHGGSGSHPGRRGPLPAYLPPFHPPPQAPSSSQLSSPPSQAPSPPASLRDAVLAISFHTQPRLSAAGTRQLLQVMDCPPDALPAFPSSYWGPVFSNDTDSKKRYPTFDVQPTASTADASALATPVDLVCIRRVNLSSTTMRQRRRWMAGRGLFSLLFDLGWGFAGGLCPRIRHTLKLV